MSWSKVGDWIKDNAGTGAALVGSLLTGNVPGAIAAGVSLVSGATGTDDPIKALAELQSNPEAIARLKELANQENDSIRKHIETMAKIKAEAEQAQQKDDQHSHEQTQLTIRNGDNAESRVVKYTRPGQSWISLFAALYYALAAAMPSEGILMLLLTLPFTYAGLREFGKWASLKKAP